MDVSKIILEQLGGRRFLAMTGAKNLVGDASSLSMRLPGIARCHGQRMTGIRIVLDPSDTYTVQAVVIRKLEYKVLESHAGVYCDNLQSVFTALTGLDTHL